VMSRTVILMDVEALEERGVGCMPEAEGRRFHVLYQL